MIPEPTIRELIATSASAVRGAADKNADFVRGSDYEALLGPAAIVWSRQASRDTDLFNAVNFHTADGDDLTMLVKKRFGKDRILDTRGTGTAKLVRPTGGIAETIWRGTRISILGSSPQTYRVTQDTAVATTDVEVMLPVEALIVGPGTSVRTTSSNVLRIDDTLKDSSWVAVSLVCADGTTFEKADTFRTRVRQERTAARVGQSKAIIKACGDTGAQQVVLFRCDYAGDAYDCGLNVCYVGDSGYTGTPELVKACFLALRRVRVAGDNLQVLPMSPTSLSVSVDVYLNDSPALFDLGRLERIHTASVRQYLHGPSGRFSYTLDGLRGSIARFSPEVQRVEFVAPTSDVSVVSGPMKAFPAALNRYIVGDVSFRYHAA